MMDERKLFEADVKRRSWRVGSQPTCTFRFQDRGFSKQRLSGPRWWKAALVRNKACPERNLVGLSRAGHVATILSGKRN